MSKEDLRNETGEYLDMPESLLPREYGKKQTQAIPLSLLIRLDQVRSDVNPSTPALRDSIFKGDLINQIDVARMTSAGLSSYIDFVNRVWGSDYSIDSCPVDTDGYYYLVMAGHSRTEAIMQIEADKAKLASEQGFEVDPGSALIWSKILIDPTPEEIIAMQLDENIYKMPSEERRAMAIVETFLFGLERGKWSTKAEFLRLAGKKFSKESLDNALFFVNLEPEHRDLVFCGAVKYGPAIEVARSIEPLKEYAALKHFGVKSAHEVPKDSQEDFRVFISQWCGNELGIIQHKKLNVTAARKRYDSLRKSWQLYVRTFDLAPLEEQLTFDQDFMVARQREAWDQARRKLKSDYGEIMNRLSIEPLYAASIALSIHSQIYRDPTVTEVIKQGLENRLATFVNDAGRLATERRIEEGTKQAAAQGSF